MPRLDTNTPWPTNLIFAIFGKIDGKDTNSPWDLDINDSSEVERRLNNVLLQIDERGADILVLRFKNKMTYEEIGKKYNVKRDHVPHIESKAIRALRHPNKASQIIRLGEYEKQTCDKIDMI